MEEEENMTRKKTKGRQKIEMKKLEKEKDRMIKFLKRRSGIYEKISESSTLCGAEVRFLAFSGARHPFTFGYPSFEPAAKRFMNEDRPQNNNNSSSLHRNIVNAHRKVTVNELNRQCNRLMDELEVKKERMKALTPLMNQKETQEACWLRIDPNEIHDVEVLAVLTAKFKEFHDRLCSLLVIQTTRGGAPCSSLLHFSGFINVEDANFRKNGGN